MSVLNPTTTARPNLEAGSALEVLARRACRKLNLDPLNPINPKPYNPISPKPYKPYTS